MKIVVFTDVHGSLNSLKQLFSLEDFVTADKKIFLGDVFFGCSRPNECVDLLKNSDCICLLGNNDFYIADHIPEADLLEFSERKLEQAEWMKKNISDENKRVVLSWPKEYILKANNNTIYFSHYAWEKLGDDFSVMDSPKVINSNTRNKLFKGVSADYIIFGHEHTTSYIVDQNRHYFCLATLGLKPQGSYLVININGDEIKLEEKFIDFDINEEIKLMDKAGYPYSKQKIQRK